MSFISPSTSQNQQDFDFTTGEIFVILTFRAKKLLVSADLLHGIIRVGGRHQCLFCNEIIDTEYKEHHKYLTRHRTFLENHPYLDDHSEHLLRSMDDMKCFCTICGVILQSINIMRHLESEEHLNELNKATFK